MIDAAISDATYVDAEPENRAVPASIATSIRSMPDGIRWAAPFVIMKEAGRPTPLGDRLCLGDPSNQVCLRTLPMSIRTISS